MKVINIIPNDYKGDPKKALGYCWQDYATKTPGNDVVVECSDDGVDYMAAAHVKMAELGVTDAYVNCMWCGGFSGKITVTENKAPAEQPAPLSAVEVTANKHNAEMLEVAELDRENENNFGYCKKCHSYCYGDCEANI